MSKKVEYKILQLLDYAIVNKPKEEEKTFVWMNQGVNNGL